MFLEYSTNEGYCSADEFRYKVASKIHLLGLNDTSEYSSIKNELDKLPLAYNLALKLNDGIKRNNGDDAFIHAIETAETYLQYVNDFIDSETIIAAFLHDVIEDHELTFEYLIKYGFSEKSAIMILIVSKNPWQEYLTNQEKSTIDSVKNKKIISTITKKAKARRNLDYYPKFQSIIELEKKIIEIINIKNIQIGKEEITLIAIKSILIKLADRANNLKTQWNENYENNIELAEKKTNETEEYFLQISACLNKGLHKEIKTLLFDLKAKITIYNYSKKVKNKLVK